MNIESFLADGMEVISTHPSFEPKLGFGKLLPRKVL
jgi:hypothetical protein